MKFFNTLSGQLEEFTPLKEGEVRMYACGPTVYDFAHIGNFRTFVFEDLLRRFLEYKKFKVNHVMNVTDVDDKTIAGANKEGKNLQEFTQKYVDAFNEDLKTLNILPPAKQPKATAEIPAMTKLIEKLIEKKAAYVNDGSVYYRVDSFKNYGKLSKKDLLQNIKGARVDVDEYDKEDGSDFALWKKAKEGEPSWDSPWGKGRPGWHIECSAMSMKYLGESFDLHLGGEDLIFPHHENEIAQSEGATGKPFVKYWLHAKHLLVDGEKMSKSKGNFYTLRDLLAKGYDPMVIRFSLLSVHYRQQLNFTLEKGLLDETTDIIERLDGCYYRCLSVAALAEVREVSLANKKDFENQSELKDYLSKILDALHDDLNISIAFAKLSEAIRGINSWFPNRAAIDSRQLRGALYFFEEIDKLFGFNIAAINSMPKNVTDWLLERIELRRQKKFDQADQIRKRIEEAGWFVEDPRPDTLFPSIVRKKLRTWNK